MIGRDEAYNELANAIITEAVKDYKWHVKRIISGKGKDTDYNEISKIEMFIKSEYFRSLTKVDPQVIMEYLEKQWEGKKCLKD